MDKELKTTLSSEEIKKIEARSRNDFYLKAMIENNQETLKDLPEPRTREEHFLHYLANNPQSASEETMTPILEKMANDGKIATSQSVSQLQASLEDNMNELNVKLSSKRNISDKITGSELSISSDADKIKLINLSEEVQRTMAGTAPVISSVADKSITSNKYADKSIPFSALSDNYNMGNLLSGISLNDITKNGIYRYNVYTCTNTPIPGKHGLVIHNTGFAGNSVQWGYILDSTYEVYTRTGMGSTWGEWNRIFPAKPYKWWDTVYDTQEIDKLDAEQCEHSGVYFTNRMLNGPADMGYGVYMLNVTVYNKGHKLYYLQSIPTDGVSVNKVWVGYKPLNKAISWDRVLLIGDNIKASKKICLLGDSIMAQMKTDIFKTITGANTTNKAKGGSSVALRTNGTATEWNPWSLCNITKKDVVNSVDIENYDIFTIWIGTNDWGHNHPIGEIDSIDEYTVLGAMNVTIKNIYNRKPQAKVLIITPTFRGSGDIANEHGTLRDLSNKIEEFSNYYGIPCLNSYKEGLINEYNKSAYLNSDLLHLSPHGIDSLSQRNAQFVNSNC